MQVNIYYGGRGLIDDPTLYTIEKIAQVLDELRVTVERYNLYEDKSGISVLPKTLKDADGVILAASVEWYGIGGYLQQFLDACWLYGDKEKNTAYLYAPGCHGYDVWRKGSTGEFDSCLGNAGRPPL